LPNALLAFQFTFTLEPGIRFFSVIEVQAPQQYFLSCSGGDLHSISLPGGPPDCNAFGFGGFTIFLNETLTPGAYAFAAKMSLTADIPQDNVFALIVRERSTELIIDAALELPGKPFVPLQMTQPSLAWSTAGFGGLSSVTVGFTFTNTTNNLRALLISLPEGFRHLVREPQNVKMSNAMLPLMKGRGDWIYLEKTASLRVFLEPTDPEIAIGSYRLTFPVLLPETLGQMPPWNLWSLSLCTDRTWCTHPQDLSVIMSFPMAGFAPGEISYLEQKRIQAVLDTQRVSSTVANSAQNLKSNLRSCWLLFCSLSLLLSMH